MHLSLKSSLGRQYLDDAMGNKLLSEFGGAAAAYSLRNLTGNGGDVVRVRRESDNAERDFTAQDITSGEMVNWVNRQLVPPLDIGVETSDGRPSVPDGGTSIGTPAAAYSLRSLGTTQADDIIPSGDTVTPSAGAYVVQVRRSSDNNVRSFTASEVSDGTLEGWVNEDVTIYQSDFSSGLDGFVVDGGDAAIAGQTFEGVLNAVKHTPSASASSGHRIRRLSTIPKSSIVSLRLLVYIPSSNTVSNGVELRNAAGDLVATTSTTDEWVVVEVTGTTGSGNSSQTLAIHATSGGNRSFTGNGTDVIYYKNASVTVTSADGFVRTWYDQSGNDNHATQTTPDEQPKVVDGGDLVDGGIDFDGSDDVLETSVVPPNAATIIGVANFDVSGISQVIVGARDSADQRSYLGLQSTNVSVLGNKTGTLTGGSISAGADFLLFGVHDVGVRLISTNGTVVSNTSGAASNNTTQGYSIGGLNDAGTNISFFNGKIAEVIIYDTDQSDNRTAIEANLGEHYSITGIPAYDDTVNGFVETWYDQSGNGNHATQLVAANQPKIVGEITSGQPHGLLDGVDFDGVNDKLSFDSSISLSTNDFFVTSVLKVLDGDGEDIIIVSNAAGNRFLMSLDYDNSSAQMRADDGTFITESFADAEPTGNILATVQRVSNTTTLFHQGSSASTFDVTSKSFTLGSFGQRTPAQFSKHSISEIIIYNTDQSANRSGIETNINNHYSIYS